jgi:6-phosphofructokinase
MTVTARRVAINTGGSDAPGLNAVIHGAVYAARGLGWQIFGIRDGYDGFLEPQNYPLVPRDSEFILVSRALDICFGGGNDEYQGCSKGAGIATC